MMVVDIETSGLDPKRHSILSIGAVDYYDSSNEFYVECALPYKGVVNLDALAINGFKLPAISQVNSKRLAISEALDLFIDWTKTCVNPTTIAGQNVAFDRAFLQETMAKCDKSFFLPIHVVDLHSLYYFHLVRKNLLPSSTFSLRSIAHELDVLCESEPHNALEGARCAMRCIRRLNEL